VGLQNDQLVHQDLSQALNHRNLSCKSEWLAMAKKLF
jgi:hypothetical protein